MLLLSVQQLSLETEAGRSQKTLYATKLSPWRQVSSSTPLFPSEKWEGKYLPLVFTKDRLPGGGQGHVAPGPCWRPGLGGDDSG